MHVPQDFAGRSRRAGWSYGPDGSQLAQPFRAFRYQVDLLPAADLQMGRPNRGSAWKWVMPALHPV